MNAPTRLALFAVAVVLTFAGSFALGATVGPDLSGAQPAGQGVEQQIGEDMDHGDA